VSSALFLLPTLPWPRFSLAPALGDATAAEFSLPLGVIPPRLSLRHPTAVKFNFKMQ
jgi:hypothetical protein